MTLFLTLARRGFTAMLLAASVALGVPSAAVAGPAPWTLTSAQPSSAHVGAKGFMTFHVAMTPPNAAVGTPIGYMTVRMSPTDDAIWCFPNTGTLCYMSYAGPNSMDVHIYMSKLAATAGTMRLQLQDPKSSQSPVYYSTVLTIPIVANPPSGVGAHGGGVPHPVGPIESMKPLKPILPTPAPSKT